MVHSPWQGDLGRAGKSLDLLKELAKSSGDRRFRPLLGGWFAVLNLASIVCLVTALLFVPPLLGGYGRAAYGWIVDRFRYPLTPVAIKWETPKVIDRANCAETLNSLVKDDETRDALLRVYGQLQVGQNESIESIILLQSSIHQSSWFKFGYREGSLKLSFEGNAQPRQGIAILYDESAQVGQNAYREVALEKDSSRFLTGRMNLWRPESHERLILLIKTNIRDSSTKESQPFPRSDPDGYKPKTSI